MRHAYHRGFHGRELGRGFGKGMGFQRAALGEGLGEEIQHHRPFLERFGHVEVKGLAGHGGGRPEAGRCIAGLECGLGSGASRAASSQGAS